VPHRLNLVLLAVLLGCGEPAGPYETAGLEVRGSGGDEIISDEGEGVGTDGGPGLAAPVATRDAFLDALNQAKTSREHELSRVDPAAPSHRRLRAELAAIDYKLRNLDLAFLQQRNAFVLAQAALTNFVYQYAPEREWEVSYALRSGDIGLSSSIVQDVLARAAPQDVRPVEHVEIPQEETALDQEIETHIADMAVDDLRIEMLGTEVLLKLAQLAIEAAELGEAERQFRACLNQETDLTVRNDALAGYAALLELLGRNEEARRIDSIASRALNIQK